MKTKQRSKKSFNLDKWLRKQSGSLKEAAGRAKDDKGGFEEFDDGRYKMQLRAAELGTSNTSGRVQVTTTWKFLSGDYKGKSYKSYRGVDDADGQFYFLLDAKRLGYEIEDFDPKDLPDLLEQMSKDKPVMKITLRTKGEYQNALINGPAEDDEDEDNDEDDAPKKKKKREDDDDDEDDEDEPKKKKSKKDDEEDDEEDGEKTEDDDEEDEPRKKKSKKDDDEEEEEESDDDDDEDDEDEPKKKKSKKDDEEDDEEDGEKTEDMAVTIGSIVKVKIKGKKMKAEVTEIFEDDQEVKVKTPEGKTVRIAADEILSVVDMPKKRKK